jgi:hypothetical protein
VEQRLRTDRLLGFGYMGIGLMQMPLAWRIANDPHATAWERGFWWVLLGTVVVISGFRFGRGVLRLRGVGRCERPGIEQGFIASCLSFCCAALLALWSPFAANVACSLLSLVAISISLYYFAWPAEATVRGQGDRGERQ